MAASAAAPVVGFDGVTVSIRRQLRFTAHAASASLADVASASPRALHVLSGAAGGLVSVTEGEQPGRGVSCSARR
jgi:hypothetical protein